MRRNQYSSLILTGQMTRKDALLLLENSNYDSESNAEDFEYIAKKLGITYEELKYYEEMPKKYYWDYPNMKNIFDFGEFLLRNL